MLVGVLLIGMALYLVWFPEPQINMDATTLSISSVIGTLLLLAGGTLVLKRPFRH
jgi:hypothetical protein